jgi:hypothetical protein
MQRVGKDGGLILAPTHMVEPEVPWENIVAYVETVTGQPITGQPVTGQPIAARPQPQS